MSLMHYFAANREMPLGEFGSIKVKEHNKDKQLKRISFKKTDRVGILTPLPYFLHPSSIDDDEVDIYEKFEDAAGICINNIEQENEIVKTQFKNKYAYALYPNLGSFALNEKLMEINPEMYYANQKCLNELFSYIRSNSYKNEEVEIYTCWYGEGNEKRNDSLYMEIDLNKFKLYNGFMLLERQYILVRT